MKAVIGLPALGGLILSATVWGLAWWPLRHLQALGLAPLWTTAWVFGLATVLLGLGRPSSLGMLARQRGLWALALASGATNAAFNLGVSSGDVVRVVLLFYLMPVWALLLARWLLREPWNAVAALRVLLALVGAAVALWPEQGGWPWPRHASEWLGLSGGMLFALTNVLLVRNAQAPAAGRLMAMLAGSLVLAVALGLLGGGSSLIPASSPLQPRLLPMLGALALGLLAGNLGLAWGAARLPAAVTAVVMTVEIPVASVSASWLGAGTLTDQSWIGGSLIVLAVALSAWPRRGRVCSPA